MKLRVVPARQGARWILQGVLAVRTFPVAYATAFAGLAFLGLFLLVIPMLGPLLVGAAMPFATLVLMVATRLASEGTAPSPQAITVAMRMDRPRFVAILQLGIAYVAGVFLIIWIGNLVDDGAYITMLNDMQSGQLTADDLASRLAADGGLIGGFVLRSALLLILATTLWRASALVFWDAQGCAKSIFSSALACWVNRGAFLVYAASWVALSILLSFVLSLLELFLHPVLLVAVSVAAFLGFSSLFYASLYFIHADCFAPDEPPAFPTQPISKEDTS
jgi:hypothetical protein